MSSEPDLNIGLAEDRLHRVFRIGAVLKGLLAIVEVASGVALYVVSSQTIQRLAEVLTQHELREHPQDVVANRLLEVAHHLSIGTQSFYAFYLLSHGLIKLVLVAGLLRERLWAYPVSILALTAFIAYQLYRYSYTHGLGLILLTLFDVIFVALAIHEWRALRVQPRAR